MATGREKALKMLDEISLEKNSGTVIDNENDFETIYREAFIKYKEMEGRLIWDYDLILNELTFIDNRTGKHYSLGKSQHDGEVADIFYYLAQKYENNNHKCFSEITIVYESKKAKEAAGKITTYLKLQKYDTILLDVKEYQYLEKNNQLKTDKVIILGHNSYAKVKIESVGRNKIGPGMEIGYDKHICVLMANRSAFKNRMAGRFQFGLYYENEIKELGASAKKLDISLKFDNNKLTTVSMYNFLLTAFVEKKYLDHFLELKYANNFKNRADELCEELQTNSLYKKYITPDLLNKICVRQKFFTDLPKKRNDENENAWRDLYKSDLGIWSVQRYWVKDHCRIFNTLDKTKAYGTAEQILCPILEHCHRKQLLEKITNRDWGIVFCGGGGKGAYQIGVWKWLIEHGIADKITGVSGASVGALNSLLFVEGNYELAEEIWHSVVPKIIMDQNAIPILQDQNALSNLLEKYLISMENITKHDKLVYSALTCVNGLPINAGIEFLNKGAVIKNETFMTEYYSWAARKKEEIKEIVLASAALPVLKQARQFEGKHFVDGGLADNVPIRPLVEDGFRNIIIVHLDNKELGFTKAVKNLDISNVKLYPVHPSESLGNIYNAGAALTIDRIALGYKDAENQLKKILSV